MSDNNTSGQPSPLGNENFCASQKKIFGGQSYPVIPAMYGQLSHLPKEMHERWHGVIQQAMAVILGENP